MGNRAVVTTRHNFENNGVGLYLHWNGGEDSIEAFLTYCKIRGFRKPEEDNYGWACLATVIGNFFGDGLSLGVDKLEKLNCNNGDNGVYIIQNWEIVDRKYKPSFSTPRCNSTLEEFVIYIDRAQPEEQQLGAEVISEYFKERDNEMRENAGKLFSKI